LLDMESQQQERKYAVDVNGAQLVRNRTHIKTPLIIGNSSSRNNMEDVTERANVGTFDDDREPYMSPRSNILVRWDYMKSQETPNVEVAISNAHIDANKTPKRQFITTPTVETDCTVPRWPTRETRAPRRLWDSWDYILK
jgi:hypothetical protein